VRSGDPRPAVQHRAFATTGRGIQLGDLSWRQDAPVGAQIRRCWEVDSAGNMAGDWIDWLAVTRLPLDRAHVDEGGSIGRSQSRGDLRGTYLWPVAGVCNEVTAWRRASWT
jgi:hypothetical protein